MKIEYLIESSSEGIFAFNRDFKLTICNKKIRTFLGFENDDWVNSPLFDSIALLNNAIDKQHISIALSGESIARTGKVFYDQNNETYVHFDLELSPVRDSDDLIIGGMGTLKSLQSFDVNNERVSVSGDKKPEYIPPKITFDMEGKPIFFNESYRKSCGMTPKVEKYISRYYNLFRDEQLLDQGLVSQLKKRTADASVEMPLINYDTKKTASLKSLDFKQKSFSGYIHPQRNKQGVVNSIEVTLVDMSVKAVDDNLSSAFYKKIQKLTKNLPVVIYEYVVHPKGGSYFRYISKNCIEILGINDIDIQENGRLLKNHIHPKDIVSYLKSLNKADSNFESWKWEGRMSVNRKHKWFRGTSRPEKQEDGSIVRYGVLADISAEKKAILHEGITDQRLELALQGGDLGLWDCYLSTGKIVVNDRFGEIIGYGTEVIETLGEQWMSLIHEEEQPSVYKQMVRHIKGQSEFFDIEMRIKTGSGQWHWIHSRGQVTERSKDNRATRLTGTIQNIDKRKENEQILLESERRYRDLTEYSPLAIAVHCEGKIVFANKQTAKFLGAKSTQELIGRNVLDFIQKKYREVAVARIQTIYKNREAAPMAEENFIDLKGNKLVAEVVGIPYQYEGKNAVQLIARDITERKKTERVLKRSEQLLSQLFENVPIGIVLLDEKRRVIQINKGFEDIFGYNNDEAFGQKLNSLIIPKEARGEAINITKLITGGKVIKEVETLRKKKDGSLVPVMIYGLPVKLKEKVIAVYGIYVDVTVSKTVEGELKIRNEELDNFVYKVSHDLRAPLSSTLGLIHLAKLEGENADLSQYIELIGDRITQLDRFITDVLSHSKNLNLDVVNSQIDFQAIIDKSFEELHYLPGVDIVKRDVTIDSEPFTNDQWRVSEVLRNLISNALKYLNPEIDDPYIKIDIKIDNEHCNISFEDNGIGITEELQSRVFEMFYRATEYSEGSGIGLYIVKNAIDKMGGNISLESAPYKGTKFYISLPNK
jgi:PAS domain S-box-containing protein